MSSCRWATLTCKLVNEKVGQDFVSRDESISIYFKRWEERAVTMYTYIYMYLGLLVALGMFIPES